MRLLTLWTMLLVVAIAQAKPRPEEVVATAQLEKLGAKVTLDEEAGDARLIVSFATLDDLNSAKLRNMGDIRSLTVEDASRCSDKTLQAISTLPNLQELSLWKPNISNNGMTHLKALKVLRSLTLAECRIGDAGVAVLKDHPLLETLDLSGTSISNGAGLTLKTLDQLQSLAVSKTKFGDSGLAALKDLKNLKEILATNTDVTLKAAQMLEASISGIRIRR